MNETKSIIEAILFAAGEPIELKNLATFLKMSSKQISKEINELGTSYDDDKRGLQIISKGNTIQLVSSSRYGDSVAKFLNKKLHEPLSNAALEVLSVIAYRGPVTRAQIEHIRGVNCSFTLRNLAIKGIVERHENPADNRSYLYEASFEFLKKCGLSSVDELPEYEALHEHAIAQIPIDKTDKNKLEEKQE